MALRTVQELCQSIHTDFPIIAESISTHVVAKIAETAPGPSAILHHAIPHIVEQCAPGAPSWLLGDITCESDVVLRCLLDGYCGVRAALFSCVGVVNLARTELLCGQLRSLATYWCVLFLMHACDVRVTNLDVLSACQMRNYNHALLQISSWRVSSIDIVRMRCGTFDPSPSLMLRAEGWI